MALNARVDYCKLNSVTVFDPYPMLRIDEILDEIGQARFITTFDLTKGYWQVLVAAEDQDKTAFISSLGLCIG